MKRQIDALGNIVITINGKSYQLSKSNLDLEAFKADTNWTKDIVLLRDEYCKYMPELKEF